MKLLDRNPELLIDKGCWEQFYIDGELPVELTYATTEAKVRIDNLMIDLAYYRNSSGGYNQTLLIRVYGNKTYDPKGKYGTESVGFLFVLKTADGKVVTSTKVIIPNLIEGEDVSKCGSYYSFAPCYTRTLDKKAKYIIEIVDLI